MSSEGSERVNDLKPVKVKRIKPDYRSSKYRLRIGSNSPLKLKTITTVIIVIILSALLMFLNSNIYKAGYLAYQLKNKNLLIGFQNSAELRPTGGFWGSFALLKTQNNLLDSKLYFETNPYKKDNPLLLKSTEPLPKPLSQTYNDRPQSFVNANWEIDFPQAAKSLEWFLNQGWSEQVDGTVAISSLSIIDLLKLTGPIEVGGEIITSDNFTEVMSKKIDTEYWLSAENIKTNEPKTILKDLSPLLIKKAQERGYYKLYKFALSEAKKGRIIAFFSDNKLEKITKDLSISGEILPYSVDYLMINNANLNGGKSSLNIQQKINYSIDKSEENVISNLEISRSLNNNWPNILNRNYTRVLVPLGSKLISAQVNGEDILNSVDINQEKNSTSFGFWFSVAPGETQIANLRYAAPIKSRDLRNYNLIFQKQPGTQPDYLSVNRQSKSLYNSQINQSFIKIK